MAKTLKASSSLAVGNLAATGRDFSIPKWSNTACRPMAGNKVDDAT
jgi:hypothetical protein